MAYIIYGQKEKLVSNYTIKKYDLKGENSFFGYYDKSPENEEGTHVLFHSVKGKTNTSPNKYSNIKVVCLSLVDYKIEYFAQTRAFNWQQGSRLMWLNNHEFIYNDFDENSRKYFSKIYNILSKELRTIPHTVYDTFNGKFSITLNFQRLAKFNSDYGYFALDNSVLSNVKDDGIFYNDLKNKKSKLIVSLLQLKKLNGFLESNDLVNHLMISPDGKNLMFIHRWYNSSKKRFDRLYNYTFGDGRLKLLADEGLVSHCFWLNNENIIGYFKHASSGLNFYQINISTGIVSKLSSDFDKFGDGHMNANSNNLIIDTYPKGNRMQYLYLWDFDKESMREIGSFFSPLRFKETSRCDLHPRFNKAGDKVFFDSTFEGERKLYSVDI